MFKLYDVMFLVKSLKSPSPCFHIADFISFSHSNTRSTTANKLQHIHSCNNFVKNFYFNRLPSIWNAVPPIDLLLSITIIKTRLYNFFGITFCLIFNQITHALFILFVPVVNAQTPLIPLLIDH